MFEYKIHTQRDKTFSGAFDPTAFEAALNAHAADGWRLAEGFMVSSLWKSRTRSGGDLPHNARPQTHSSRITERRLPGADLCGYPGVVQVLHHGIRYSGAGARCRGGDQRRSGARNTQSVRCRCAETGHGCG